MAPPKPKIKWLSPAGVSRSLRKALRDPLFARRLILVTASLMKSKTFHTIPLKSVFEPLDFVQTVVVKLLAGERRIRAGSPNGFILSLLSCIESEINNTVTLKESSSTEMIDPASSPINSS